MVTDLIQSTAIAVLAGAVTFQSFEIGRLKYKLHKTAKILEAHLRNSVKEAHDAKKIHNVPGTQDHATRPVPPA